MTDAFCKKKAEKNPIWHLDDDSSALTLRKDDDDNNDDDDGKTVMKWLI